MTEIDETENAPEAIELAAGELRILTLCVEGGMLVVALLLGYFLGERFWEGESGILRGIVVGSLASIPLLVFVIGVAESSSKLGDQLRRDFVPVVAMFRNVTLLDIAFVSFMAGLCEEALFRGFGQNYLAGYVGDLGSLLIVSVVFGFFHFLSFSYLVFASVIGLYLGGLYIWTDSLVVPIAAHAAYDFVALAYGTRFLRVKQDSHATL